jgi:CheY-like chemotaxis protein
VSDAGGCIDVESAPGVGTTMKVYLPSVQDARADSSEPPLQPTPASISANVLVVEDEEMVRRSAVRALEAMGCAVVAAASGQEALTILGSPAAIDLVFTDVVMPGLSGPQMVTKAKETRADLKVLFTTGYTSDMTFRMGQLSGVIEVLPKPYTATSLSRKVREVLAGTKSEPERVGQEV